jgi:hypothetical protein
MRTNPYITGFGATPMSQTSALTVGGIWDTARTASADKGTSVTSV